MTPPDPRPETAPGTAPGTAPDPTRGATPGATSGTAVPVTVVLPGPLRHLAHGAEVPVSLSPGAASVGDALDALVAEVLANDPRNVPALRFQVARLIDAQDLEAAIQAVRVGLDEAPEDVQLLRLAGRAQELAGNLELAGDRLARATRAADYAPGVVSEYVDFLGRISRPDAAASVLTEAVQRNPENADLVDRLATIRLALEEWEAAEAAIATLEPLDADRARTLRAAALIGQQRFEEGRTLLSEDLGEGFEGARTMTAVVNTFLQDRDVEGARTFLEGVLEDEPENLQAIGLLGNLARLTGDAEAARARYERILEIDPANGAAVAALSALAAQEGDLEEAERIVRAGLEAAPGDLVLMTRLAQYEEVQGDYDAAIDLYEAIYASAPDSLVIANNLASLLADHRRDDPEAVERAYRIAGRLRPSSNLAYRDTYGWTRHLRGEHREALDFIKPVAEALPGNPWARYHVGMVHAALDQPAEARENLEAALELSEGTAFPPADG